MADEDYGAAQPIADVFKGAYKKANDLVQMIPGFGTKPAPSADPQQKPNQVDPEDVRKATATFADKPEGQKIPTQTKAQQRPSVAPKVQIKSSLKVMPRKR
jgi:hypothetical protein